MSCIWITGLSGAGKSTLATALVPLLKGRGEHVVFLDGDALREVFGAFDFNSENHKREARIALAMRYSHLCRILSGQGLTVVIATISMFAEVHAWNRDKVPGYFEVFLPVPMEVLRMRDPKGIYGRFDAGELSDVAGLDLLVDEPAEPDLTIQHAWGLGPAEAARKLLFAYDQSRS